MKNFKISVIIPVYNTEKYLKECLDSVLNQTLEDIEIICIDDGSTDNSLEILTSYSNKGKIKLISQENQGAGFARNTGLKHAHGKYVSFLDSDDWIDSQMLEKLYHNAEKHDSEISMCQLAQFNNVSKNIINDNYFYTFDCINSSYDNKIFNMNDIDGFAPFPTIVSAKIFKKEFLDETKVTFHNTAFEDTLFFFQVYIKAKRASFIREFLYFYRINLKDSTMGSNDKRYFDIIKIMNYISESMKSQNLYEKHGKGFINWKLRVISRRFITIQDKYKLEFLDLIKNDLKNLSIKNIDHLNKFEKNIYNSFLNSKDPQECKHENIIHELKNEINLLNWTKQEISNKYDKISKDNNKLSKKNSKLKEKNELLSKKNSKLALKNTKLILKNKKFKNNNIRYNKMIKSIYSSKSWKITKPFRKISNFLEEMNKNEKIKKKYEKK